jgi:uncharacterized lipoprotein YehR (DUF1307 family)
MNKIKSRQTITSFSPFFRIIKYSFKIASISVVFLLVFVLTSCKDSNNEANVKIEVAAAIETLNNTIIDPNEELLKDISLPQLTYGHSTGVIENQQKFIDQLVNGDFDYTSVRKFDQTIDVLGDTAIVRHILAIEGRNVGQSTTFRLGVILCFQRQGGNWRLLARQGYKL